MNNSLPIDMLTVGTRVRLRHDVDRYPHFIAGKGMVGTVTHGDEFTVCVRMDEHIPGAEDWDNEVIWSDDDPVLEDVEIIDEESATARER